MLHPPHNQAYPLVIITVESIYFPTGTRQLEPQRPRLVKVVICATTGAGLASGPIFIELFSPNRYEGWHDGIS